MEKLRRVVINDIKGVKDVVAVPSYDGTVNITSMSFLMEQQLPLGGQGNVKIFGD